MSGEIRYPSIPEFWRLTSEESKSQGVFLFWSYFSERHLLRLRNRRLAIKFIIILIIFFVVLEWWQRYCPIPQFWQTTGKGFTPMYPSRVVSQDTIFSSFFWVTLWGLPMENHVRKCRLSRIVLVQVIADDLLSLGSCDNIFVWESTIKSSSKKTNNRAKGEWSLQSRTPIFWRKERCLR